MDAFFSLLVSTWWGIIVLCVVAVLVWLLLSALLYRVFFKRLYDVVLSGLALIVLSPVFIILIVVGAIKMKGNPLFVQRRPGKINKKTGKEKVFSLIKFRTMTCEKDEEGKLLPDEKRLTRYGKILRSTSLDELPELINIFVGHMSIIGPRPLLVKDMVFMSDNVRERHTVRGGLTGLAQVNGRNNITWEQKFEYDLIYIDKISLFGDLKIIFKTVLKVFMRSDVIREGTESDIDYGDWLLNEGKIDKEAYETKQLEAKEMLRV